VKAIDTNILARFVLRDDDEQHTKSAALMSSGESLYVPVTVTLELAWVLRSSSMTVRDVGLAFRLLRTLPMLHFEHGLAVDRTLELHAAGFDFADALHLCCSLAVDQVAATCSSMFTFDQALAKKAKKAKLSVELL
jgi:predicted nucleic-acid-binding protein